MSEIIGFIATAFIVVSLWQEERVWLHRINTIGSTLFVAQALMFRSITFTLANIIIIGINLSRLKENNKPKQKFTIIPKFFKKKKN